MSRRYKERSGPTNRTGTAKLGSSPTFYDGKVAVYREFNNLPLLELVQRVLPPGGSVLDVGCASGGLLARLPHAGFRAGLEVSKAAAAEAERVADQVVARGVDDLEASFPEGSFDVVVCADVLEHVPDPTAALARASDWTAQGGAVVICVPNIANWKARLRLLRGVWRYEESGIWDSGHLRFFTFASLHSMIADASLTMESVDSTQAVVHQLPFMARAGPIRAITERTLTMLARRRPQLFAFQLICVARKL